METETVKTVKLEIKQNVHPNTDGGPWGWIQVEGTRLSVSAWSGYDEKKRCEEMIKGCNSYYELLKLIHEADAWLSFNSHPSPEEIQNFRKSLQQAIKKAEQ